MTTRKAEEGLSERFSKLAKALVCPVGVPVT